MDFVVVIWLIVISIPIFYLYGLLTFISKLFKSKDKTQHQSFLLSQPDKKPDQDSLLKQLKAIAAANPTLTVAEFLQIHLPGNNQPVKASHYVQTKKLSAAPTQTQSSPLPSQSSPPQPEFNLISWYSDNSINLLLYLGAFLIVAAVSLFISFQWASFSGVGKFGVVVLFTLAWFLAGHIAFRSDRVRNAGVSFLAISALLIPFNGLAWQQFIVGGFTTSFGLTWLGTSIVAIGMYVYLTILIKHRAFHYFAQLSVLSTALAFVNLNQAPIEYYVLASICTALVLLITQIWFRTHISASLAQDTQQTSLVILLVANLGGLLLLPTTNIPFFSAAITLVLVLNSIYFWLLYSLDRKDYLLVISQVITVAVIGHGLKVLNLNNSGTLYAMAAANFLQQIGLNRLLANRRQDFRIAKIVSVSLTGSLYFLGLILDYDGLLPAIMSLVLGLHAAIAAIDLENDQWHLISAGSVMVFVWHLLLVSQLDLVYFPVVFLVVSAGMLAGSFAKPIGSCRSYYRSIALLVMLANASYFLLDYARYRLDTLYPELMATATLGVAYFTLAITSAYQWFSSQTASENERLGVLFGSVVVYLTTLSLNLPVVALICLLLVGFQAYSLTRITKSVISWVVMLLSWFVIVVHLGNWLELDDYSFLLGFTGVNLLIWYLSRTTHSLSAGKLTQLWPYAAVAASSLTGVLAALSSLDTSFTGWDPYRIVALFSGYVSFGIIWSCLDGYKKEKPFIMGLLGVLLWYWHGGLLTQIYPEIAIFNNVQLYTLPLGVYLTWAAHKLLAQKSSADTVFFLDFLSSSVIYLPTYVQASNNHNLIYTGLAIVYGLGHIIWSNQSGRRVYQQIGAGAIVLAVLLQTSDFIFALPRWLVVGLMGLSLISLALWLLLHRHPKK